MKLKLKLKSVKEILKNRFEGKKTCENNMIGQSSTIETSVNVVDTGNNAYIESISYKTIVQGVKNDQEANSKPNVVMIKRVKNIISEQMQILPNGLTSNFDYCMVNADAFTVGRYKGALNHPVKDRRKFFVNEANKWEEPTISTSNHEFVLYSREFRTLSTTDTRFLDFDAIDAVAASR